MSGTPEPGAPTRRQIRREALGDAHQGILAAAEDWQDPGTRSTFGPWPPEAVKAWREELHKIAETFRRRNLAGR